MERDTCESHFEMYSMLQISVWDCICGAGHIWMCAVRNVYSLSLWVSMWVSVHMRMNMCLNMCLEVNVWMCVQTCTERNSPVSNKGWASVQNWHSRTFHKFCCTRGLDKHTPKTYSQTQSVLPMNTQTEYCSQKTHKLTWSFSMHHLHNHCQHSQHTHTSTHTGTLPLSCSQTLPDEDSLHGAAVPGTKCIAILLTSVTCSTVPPLKLFILVIGSNIQCCIGRW